MLHRLHRVHHHQLPLHLAAVSARAGDVPDIRHRSRRRAGNPRVLQLPDEVEHAGALSGPVKSAGREAALPGLHEDHVQRRVDELRALE